MSSKSVEEDEEELDESFEDDDVDEEEISNLQSYCASTPARGSRARLPELAPSNYPTAVYSPNLATTKCTAVDVLPKNSNDARGAPAPFCTRFFAVADPSAYHRGHLIDSACGFKENSAMISRAQIPNLARIRVLCG
ncbi:hypothetical protein B0H14DRAFT_2632759 [Mycena olivaceomarginata]|nr:hypothetical protein B0H14DRAFT_2632759 [Mycena olivaceomarginata]